MRSKEFTSLNQFVQLMFVQNHSNGVFTSKRSFSSQSLFCIQSTASGQHTKRAHNHSCITHQKHATRSLSPTHHALDTRNAHIITHASRTRHTQRAHYHPYITHQTHAARSLSPTHHAPDTTSVSDVSTHATPHARAHENFSAVKFNALPWHRSRSTCRLGSYTRPIEL